MNTLDIRFRYGILVIIILILLNGCMPTIHKELLNTGRDYFVPKAYEEKTIRGLNIGNALDAPEHGLWGVKIRPEYFSVIKQAGFNTVRLPVRFSAHTGNESPYVIDAEFFAEVNNLVDHALDNGLVVILDLHHFNEVMEYPVKYEEKLLSIWDQISREYASYPDSLYFEILNEPSGEQNSDSWNYLAGRVISVVRKNDAHRKIIIDSVEFSNISTIPALSLPADDNLIVSFHFYEPFEFTHQGADWVNGSNRWLGKTWKGTKEEKELIEDRLDKVAEWSRRNRIPVLMGEFGTIEQADRDSRIRWTEFLARETEKRQIGWVYWQFCSNFALYSCDQGEWDEALLGALIPVNASK